MAKIRLLIADNQALFRETLSHLLDSDPRYKVVGNTGSGKEAVLLARSLRPDVVLLDLGLREMNGVAAIALFQRASPRTRVLALSLQAQWSQARQALQKGAHGYLARSSSCKDLKEALELVARGCRYICTDLQEQHFGQVQEVEASISALTPREREIIQLLRQGATSRQIAAQLGIGVRTVDTHRYNILHKLQLKSTTALIDFAFVHGLYKGICG